MDKYTTFVRVYYLLLDMPLPPVHMHFKEISSTNAYLLEQLDDPELPHGALVSADYQQAGRGSKGRLWHGDSAKNIYCSILLRSGEYPASKSWFITLLAALSVCEQLRTRIQDIFIKWPNDLYAADRKLGGILVESQIREGILRTVIVGIGLNVHQTEFPKMEARPISLDQVSDERWDVKSLTLDIYNRFMNYYEESEHWAVAQFLKDYNNYSYGMGNLCSINYKNNPIEGVWRGLDEEGNILIEHPDHIHRYAAAHASDWRRTALR